MAEVSESPELLRIRRQHYPSIEHTRAYFRSWVDQQSVYEPDREGYDPSQPLPWRTSNSLWIPTDYVPNQEHPPHGKGLRT
ncbi:hypothetical protein NLX83_13910 [Allokutzneria sp. A3M-2-11 16]|uniref:hypothetical protein n=1 Tax=Allokutzneria sp. A3M-2-11 16 TaxID=2962043 RepID=UPI0020B7C2D2|nr:hypothetical protein [Allokutzneria sp. A3M-2-11 16]MCP3800355.1 hypothetical protein [Allokutzneria sp. A3M-2-11 16]